VRRLSFSRDGNHLAATGGDRSVRVWDLRKEPFVTEFAAKPGKEP
jgi:WD40 repeat protein